MFEKYNKQLDYQNKMGVANTLKGKGKNYE